MSSSVAVGRLVGVSVGIGVALADTEVNVGGLLVIVGVTELVDEGVAVDVLACGEVGVKVGVLVRVAVGVLVGVGVRVNTGVLVRVPVGVIVAASFETTIWTYTLAPKGVPFLFARIQ